MALVTCPECNNIVSDQAFFCPHCGNPIQPQIKNFILKSAKTITEIAKNLFSFIVSLIFLIVSIGLLTYVAIKAFDYFSKVYLK